MVHIVKLIQSKVLRVSDLLPCAGSVPLSTNLASFERQYLYETNKFKSTHIAGTSSAHLVLQTAVKSSTVNVRLYAEFKAK